MTITVEGENIFKLRLSTGIVVEIHNNDLLTISTEHGADSQVFDFTNSRKGIICDGAPLRAAIKTYNLDHTYDPTDT